MVLFIILLIAVYNVAGCRRAQANLDHNHFSIFPAASDTFHGINELGQSNYASGAADISDAAAKLDAYGDQETQLVDVRNGARFWAWVWVIIAVIALGNSGNSKAPKT